MSLRSRLAGWIAGNPQRAAGPPIETLPTFGQRFGPGIGNQPSHEVLLQQNRGIPDVATRAIANRVATLEPLVKTSRRDMSGTVIDETLDDHPLANLLNKPHPDFSKSSILRLAAQHILSTGEAYWLKVGNRLGIPSELHPLVPGTVFPRVSRGTIESYIVRDANGKEHERSRDEVIRVWWPDPENPWGSEGVLGPSGVVADAHRYATEHVRSFFESDATPSTVLKALPEAMPWSPEEWERFVADWTRRYHQRAGTERGTPGKLPSHWDLIQLAQQTGSEMAPILEYLRDDLLMGFAVPRSVLGQVVSGDRSSAETNQWVFDRYAVTPVAHGISEAWSRQLAPDFDPSIWVDWVPFVADDKNFDLLQEQSDLDRKVRSVNLVREDRGLDPVPWGEEPIGKIGDAVFDPDDRGFGPDDPSALQVPPLDSGDDDSGEDEERANGVPHERVATSRLLAAQGQGPVLYERLFGGMLKREIRSIFRRQERATMARFRASTGDRARVRVGDLVDLVTFRTLFQRIPSILRQIFERSAEDAISTTGSEVEFIFTQQMRNNIEQDNQILIDRLGRTIAHHVQQQLSESIEEGESLSQQAKRIRGVFDASRRRATTIARTETLRASQAAQIEGFRQSGVVTRKQWITSQDEKVRDFHVPMDGVTVALNEDFVVGGELAQSPGDRRLSAANVINCRCAVVPVTDTEGI